MPRTITELDDLMLDLHSGTQLTKQQQAEVLQQAIDQAKTINEWFHFMSLIMRSGSSWSGRIREKLDSFLFGDTTPEAIAAAIKLLEKHRNVQVEDLLLQLKKLDTPINRTGQTYKPAYTSKSSR